MDYYKKFKTAAKEGFNKAEVVKYLKSLETAQKEKDKTAQALLKQEREKAKKASSIRDHIFEDLQEMEVLLEKKNEECSKLEDEIKAQKEKEKGKLDELKKEIRKLKLKGERYDDIERDLRRTHQKAQMDAGKLLDDAKEEAMESIFVIEKINKAIKDFKRDIRANEKDINDKTTNNITEILCRQAEECLSKLENIKIRFLKDNDILDR